MKHTLWLALLLPITAFSAPFTEEFCDANPSNEICVGFNADRADIDAIEVAIADHEVRITDLEASHPIEPFVARLTALDSVGTVFNSFIVASNGTGDTLLGFAIHLEQPDGTVVAVGFSSAYDGGHWPTGNINYSGTGCTGTAYYIAAWTFSAFGGDEGSILISAQAGFDGIPYTFAIGPLFSATVASRAVSGHPISAPVCDDFSPFVQTGLRLAIPVQGLPAVVVPPSTVTVQLGP